MNRDCDWFSWRHLLIAPTRTKELKVSTAGPSGFAFLCTAWVNGNSDHIFSWAIAGIFSVGGWEPRPGSATPCQIWHCLPKSDRVQMGSQRLFHRQSERLIPAARQSWADDLWMCKGEHKLFLIEREVMTGAWNYLSRISVLVKAQLKME